jgi:hypothetical protein
MKSYSVFWVSYKVKKINFIPRACNEYALHRIAVLSGVPTVLWTVLKADRQTDRQVVIRHYVPATQILIFRLSSGTANHYGSINIEDRHYIDWATGSVVKIDLQKHRKFIPLVCLRTLSQMHDDVVRIVTSLWAGRSGIRIPAEARVFSLLQ